MVDLDDPRAWRRLVASHGVSDWYSAFHAPRYLLLLQEITRELVPVDDRILDIGPTFFTELMHEQFRIRVDSLGFGADQETISGKHYQFDLNATQWPEQWRGDLPEYDLVVMGEVIEHLHTSPKLVLSFLRTLVRPGGILIVQTPNAARLGTRVKLLVGKHPYALIKEDVTEPDHFREYTRRELFSYAAATSFEVVRCIERSYFDLRQGPDDRDPRHRPWIAPYVKNVVYKVLPRGLRTGITMILRRPG